MLKINTYHSKNYHISHNSLLYGNTPFGDYLKLKEYYKSLDDDYNYTHKFKQLDFNTDFLKEKLNEVGSLTCVYCGKLDLVIFHKDNKYKDYEIMATADHFNPKNNGGEKYNKKNLVVSCYKCNQKKGAKLWAIRTLRYLNVYGSFKILVRELQYRK